jgi:hypothetical protein
MFDETACKEEHRPTSPRSAFIKKKFADFDLENEVVLDNFACAFHTQKLLLHGMLYLTDKSCYFYSPFNEKTIVGQGSKIQIRFTELKSIKKETTLFVFHNAIRFTYKNGYQALFRSFLSRDTCFSFILSLMLQQGLIEQSEQSHQMAGLQKAGKIATALRDYYE